jgi:hypothetical protein
MPETRNLRQLAERGIMQAEPGGDPILKMIGSVRWFLYKRADTYSGGGNVINWKTNPDNKLMIFSELRDSLMLRRLELRSIRCVQQMQAIVEDEGYLGAGPDTGESDDLMMALCLAHHAWVDTVRPGLVARNLTWERVHAENEPIDPHKRLSFAISQAYSDKVRAMNQKAQKREERF